MQRMQGFRSNPDSIAKVYTVLITPSVPLDYLCSLDFRIKPKHKVHVCKICQKLCSVIIVLLTSSPYTLYTTLRFSFVTTYKIKH